MSSFLRFQGGKEFLNIYKYVNQVYPKRTLLNFTPESTSSSWPNKLKFTRSCATLSSIETDTQSKKYEICKNNLRAQFFQVDSILKRNNQIHDDFFNRFIAQVQESLACGVPITPQQTSILLHLCQPSASGKDAETNIQRVMQIWRMCQEHGLPLDISHYNALLEIFVQNEYKFSPDEFLSNLKVKNLEPNHITYNRLITRFCQEGNIIQAMELFDLMKEKGLTVTEHVFNSLIMGYSKSKDLEGIHTTLDLMQKNAHQPSPDTHAALLQAYAENGKGEDLKTLLNQCKKDNIFFSVHALLDLLFAVNSNLPNDDSIREVILDDIQKINYQKSTFEPALRHLLNSGHDKIAHVILNSLNLKNGSHHLSTLPKYLASCTEDLSRVVTLCDIMFNRGINVTAFELALQSFLQNQKFNFALDLLKEMKKREIPLKDHYYYPLFCHYGAVEGKEKVWEIFEEMVKFDIDISQEFFSLYFLPSLGCSDEFSELEQIYLRFPSDQSIIMNRAYNGVILYLLKKQNVKTAVDFVYRFPRGLKITISRALASTLLKVGDVENIVHLVRHLSSIQKDKLSKTSSYDGLRKFLFFTINGLKEKPVNFEERFITLLKAMEKTAIRFPNSMVDSLKEYLGDHHSENIQNLLDNLSYPTSEFPEPQNEIQYNSVEEARRKMEMSETNIYHKLNYLTALIREKELLLSKEFVANLNSEGIIIPPLILTKLLNLYLEKEEIAEALDLLHQLLSEHPTFQVHASKIVNFANLLVSQKKYEEAVKVLEMASPKDGIWPPIASPPSSKSYSQQLSSMLSAIAEDNFDWLQSIQNILISRHFALPSFVLPYMIKYHLGRKNVDEAFAVYKKAANEMQVSSCSIQMLVAAIEKEDKDMLQEIVELNSIILGEMTSWYNLAFALLEMGNFKQVEKIFRTPGIRALHHRLNKHCQYLISTEKIAELDFLIKATKDVFGADRPRLYEYLLEGKILLDNPNEALDVWMNMQQENVIPTDAFLVRLASFLRSKDMEVPFDVPDVPTPPEDDELMESPAAPSERVMSLTSALELQDLPSIHTAWKRLKESGETYPLLLAHRIIGSFLKFDQIEDALIETKALLVKNHMPSHILMSKLLKKLSSQGNVAALEFLKTYINQAERKDVEFFHWRGLAYLNAGRMGEYLETVLQGIQENERSATMSLPHELNPVLIAMLMQHHPEHIPMLERCANALKDKGNCFMFSNFWDYYFSVGEIEKAEKIYSQHLTEENQLTTTKTCLVCHANKDTKKLDDLLHVLDQKPNGREVVKGRVFSNYIEILNSKGELEKALEVIDKSLKSIKLEHYQLSSLQKLEHELKKKGLTFPYVLEHESASSSSSSDSSSDED